MNSKEKRLRLQLKSIRAQLDKIDCSKHQKILLPLVGKYYRYLNSYGGDDAKWWLYKKITGISDGNIIHFFKFEKTIDGGIFINFDKTSYGGYLLEGDQEITQGEFDNAWQDMLSFIIKRACPSDVPLVKTMYWPFQ